MNDEVDTSLIHSFNIFLCEIESVIIKIIVIILKEKALNNFDYSPKAHYYTFFVSFNVHFLMEGGGGGQGEWLQISFSRIEPSKVILFVTIRCR